MKSMKEIKEIVLLNKTVVKQMLLNRKAQAVLGGAQKFINFIIGIAVLFFVAAAIIPVAQDAGDSLNASGLPLGTLFVSGGIVFILVAVALLNSAIKGPGK